MRAGRRGVPLHQLSIPSSGRRIQHDAPVAESSDLPLPGAERSSTGQDRADDADAEEGTAEAARRREKRLRLTEIAECRTKSDSAWLHFPHVELVFLFFAFEGAVVAQLSAIRENASPAVLCLAIAAFVRF